MIAASLGRAGNASTRLRPKHYCRKVAPVFEKMMRNLKAPSQECVGLPTQSRLGARLRPARFHLVFSDLVFSVRPQA